MSASSPHKAIPQTDISETAQRNPATGEDGQHRTFCRICEAVCGLSAEVKNGEIVKVTPDHDHPLSQGHVCVKGVHMKSVVYDKNRITQPLKKTKTGEFAEVSWEEALNDIVARLSDLCKRDGTDSLAYYSGNPLAFSSAHLGAVYPLLDDFGVWKRYGAQSMDVTSRFTANHLLWNGSHTAIPDLARTDYLLMLGANPLVSNASLLTAPRIRDDLKAIHDRGRVVVVDPRKTETARQFDHLAIKPDTDLWLLAAIANTIFQAGLHDEDFLNQYTVGWQSLAEALSPFTAELAASRCGCSVEAINEIARAFCEHERAAVYARVGICRGTYSTSTNFLVDTINLITGKFGKPGCSTFAISPFDPPANTPAPSAPQPAAHQFVNTRFGDLPLISGVMPFDSFADEILVEGEGQVRGLIMQGGNPVLSGPDAERMAEALESLEFFVAHDLYMNESNRHADYLLPATTFFERADVPLIAYLHSVRPYAQYSDAVINPVGEAREEVFVLVELVNRIATELGKPLKTPEMAPLDVFNMLTAQGIWGVDIDTLKDHPSGIRFSDKTDNPAWPDRIGYSDGKIQLSHKIVSEQLTSAISDAGAEADKLRLISRREIRSINSWMHNVERLARSQLPTLQIHPDDAQARAIEDGDEVEVSNDQATLAVIAEVTDIMTPGAVSYPHGWGHNGGWEYANERVGVNINRLAKKGAGEVYSGSCFLDGIPVEVSKVH